MILLKYPQIVTIINGGLVSAHNLPLELTEMGWENI